MSPRLSKKRESRTKILPFPDSLLCAPCREVIRWPALQHLICEFASFVRNQEIEHLWIVDASGRIRRKKGRSDSVANGAGARSDSLFEIHNHPTPKNQS